MLKNARLNHRYILLLITAQPVFISRKINQDPKEEEKKPQIKKPTMRCLSFSI